MSSPAKEYWLHCFEIAVEDLCKKHDIEWDKAEEMLIDLLDKDPHYLNRYCTYE